VLPCAQKLPLKTAAATAESSLGKLVARAAPPRRGAALKVFGDQLAYKAVSSFLLFEFEFKFPRSGRREKIALPDYSPRTSAASRTRHSTIMLLNSNVDVFAKSNVKPAPGIPDDVNAIRHRWR
jgi:hypothetical protein